MSDSKAPQTTEKPKDESTSQLVAPPAQVPRLVKVRALLPIRPTGQDTIYNPGAIVEVTEEDAREFCDRTFVGNFGISGMFPEMQAEQVRHRVKRAERVTA